MSAIVDDGVKVSAELLSPSHQGFLFRLVAEQDLHAVELPFGACRFDALPRYVRLVELGVWQQAVEKQTA